MAQGTHHLIMVVQKQRDDGRVVICNWSTTITPKEGWTRWDVWQYAREAFAREVPHMADGGVTFFDLQRNEIA